MINKELATLTKADLETVDFSKAQRDENDGRYFLIDAINKGALKTELHLNVNYTEYVYLNKADRDADFKAVTDKQSGGSTMRQEFCLKCHGMRALFIDGKKIPRKDWRKHLPDRPCICKR